MKGYGPQTDDPGANHTVTTGKVTGMIDFTGQQGRDEAVGETPAEETSDREISVRYTDTSNPLNGSGGGSRTIDPSKVKGSNP